jgi:flagellar biosynthesis protein FlhB
MNTACLVVSRMATGGAVGGTVGTVLQLVQSHFAVAAICAILTGVLFAIAVAFQLAYNRYQYQLRNMAHKEEMEPELQEGQVLHVYSSHDLGGPA